MKKIRKTVFALAMMMVLTLSSSNVTFAKEAANYDNYLSDTNDAITESVGTFEAVALATQGMYNFSRTQKTYTVTGRYSKSNSSFIELEMPRDQL